MKLEHITGERGRGGGEGRRNSPWLEDPSGGRMDYEDVKEEPRKAREVIATCIGLGHGQPATTLLIMPLGSLSIPLFPLCLLVLFWVGGLTIHVPGSRWMCGCREEPREQQL